MFKLCCVQSAHQSEITYYRSVEIDYIQYIDHRVYDQHTSGVTWGILWEYGAPRTLLQVIQSLYNQSESCVCIQWVLDSINQTVSSHNKHYFQLYDAD